MSESAALERRISATWGDPASATWADVVDAAKAAKEGCQSEDELNKLWSIEALAGGLATYCTAYADLVAGRYYEGWCALERAELAMLWSSRNPFLPGLTKRIDWLARRVELWQSLFPYRLFFSPGMRVRDWKCEICGRRSTPVSPCGHTPGKVYRGRLCSRLITKADLLEISIVTDPVQKYSVATLEGQEYDFTLVAFVLERLSGPFHPWRGAWTYRRHPHEDFSDHANEGPCPCDSGLRYVECCRPTEGVRIRHFAMEAAGIDEGDARITLVRSVGARGG